MIDASIAYLESLQVSETAFPNDPMNNGPPYYMQTGKSALRVIMTALLARIGYVGGAQPVRSILDLGCGYGRVTRWMRAAFPEAAITVTDLNRHSANWCAETFRAHATEQPFGMDRYDLIFLGSVFTHLAEAPLTELFDHLTLSLKRNGVLVFTTQGRFAVMQASAEPDSRINRTIDKQDFAIAVENFHSSGFGFVANKGTPDYGSVWTAPRWFFEKFGGNPDLVQIMFQEKGWDNFQDAYAYIRAPIAERGRSRT